MDGNTFVANDGTRVDLAKAPNNSAGRPVTLGVRPEHFHLDPNGLPAEILTVEPTGSETQVVAKFAGQEIMGAFRERITAQPGETLRVRPEAGAVHLFDTESGQRISA
jgi:multiple sugar transport system ATP-binding protein